MKSEMINLPIYVEPNGNLTFLPDGRRFNKLESFAYKYHGKLEYPYTGEELVHEILAACKILKTKRPSKILVTEMLMSLRGAKTYSEAIYGLKYLAFTNIHSGKFSFNPYKKVGPLGYQGDRYIFVENIENAEEMLNAFNEALTLCTTDEVKSSKFSDISFGYKEAWLAVKNIEAKELAEIIGLKKPASSDWNKGLKSIEADDSMIFISPPVAEWTFVIGKPLFANISVEGIKRLQELMRNISVKTGDEIQSFGTYRILDYSHWMKCINGSFERAFAYDGESAEVLLDEGKKTRPEESLNWEGLKDCSWSPNEEIVLKIAEGWGLNPTRLGNLTDGKGKGFLSKFNI